MIKLTFDLVFDKLNPQVILAMRLCVNAVSLF